MNKLLNLYARNRARGAFNVVHSATADEATVYLYDTIVSNDDEAEWWGGVSPLAFAKELASIKASIIHLRVNSPGGSVFAARAMEQAIREHKARVVVHVDGLAASAASYLMLAADEVRIAPGAFVMIHKAWTMAWGNADDLTKEAGLLTQIDASLAKTYADHTGRSLEMVMGWMAAETWFDADQAVELGFAHAIDVTPEPTAQAKAKAQAWDLSAFDKAPKEAKATVAAKEQVPAKLTGSSPTVVIVDELREPDREALRRNALRAIIPA